MALEVYTASQPAIPIRAWLSSCLLFAAVCGLASWTVWSRSSLAARISPQDWDITFRPPGRFEPLSGPATSSANAIVFHALTASGGAAQLVFRRFEADANLDADEICNRVLRPHVTLLLAVFAAPPTRSIEKIGALDAAQVFYPGIPMVVRAVRLQGGAGYAVSLRFEGSSIEEPLYRTFDSVCRAVEFKPGAQPDAR